MDSLADLQALFGTRYRLKFELGGGSMAAVYLAEDTRHGRAVALKLLRPEYAATLAAERFLREIEIAARLQHPHIVPLLDSGEVAGHLYLVLPFVEGESLRRRLVREGRLAPGEVIRIVADVAEALAYAHAKGIIHRDIKPDNILMSGRHALVTDFGVAKAVSAATLAPRDLTIGVALGTPAYMAPEQATASPGLDQRVDVYALGVMAYELLTGRPPFERPSAQAVLTAHVMEPPVPLREARPEVSPALAALVDRCLAKRPEDRWQGAEELLHQLDVLATPSGGSTPAASAPVAPSRRIRWAVLVGLGVMALAALIFGRRPRPALIGMTGTQRQLTFTGQVSGAAVSPDGKLLAFVTDSGGRSHLMVQDVRGGQAIELSVSLRFDFPSWSADGAEVRVFVFDGNQGMLRRVPRLGGTPRDLPLPFWGVLSPGDDRLAILRQGGRTLIIRDMASADSTVIPLEGGWWNSLPAWSPDGRSIAWSSNRQAAAGTNRVSMLRLGTSAAMVVAEDTMPLGSPAWSGDGRALFYMRGRDRVVDLVRLPLDATGRAAAQPELIRAGVTAGLPQNYISFQPPPSITQDGTQLVYVQRQDWSNLGIATLGDSQPGRSLSMLTEGSAVWEGARFSPDGRQVAAQRSETDGFSVQLLTLGGAPPQELGRIGGVGGLAWSPRGDQVVISSIEPDSGRALRIFFVDGSPSRVVARGQVGDTPGYGDDSNIVVPRVGNGPLLEVNSRSGRVIPYPGLDSIGYMFFPVASIDGRRVAVAWNRLAGDQRVWVFPRHEGGHAVPVAEGLYNPARWSRDGQLLYLVSGGFLADSSRVIAVRPDRASVQTLVTLPFNTEPVDVTPDGKRALVILHQQRGDAWTIQFPPRH